MKLRMASVFLTAATSVFVAYLVWPGPPSATEHVERLRPRNVIARDVEPAVELESGAMSPEPDTLIEEASVSMEDAQQLPPERMPLTEKAAASDVAEVATNSDGLDPGEQLTLHQTGTTDTSLRNADFPRTYISAIHVDLTSPNHWVRLTWSGPDADRQETGPFHSSPGRGLGYNDCNDVAESNRDGSNCTPKGRMRVDGFSNSMPMYSHCRFVTWFQVARGIAFHYYPQVPNYPASHGCVRLNEHAAQLIHNNSKIGATEVSVDGTWRFVR